jgi:hypothetical protein
MKWHRLGGPGPLFSFAPSGHPRPKTSGRARSRQANPRAASPTTPGTPGDTGSLLLRRVKRRATCDVSERGGERKREAIPNKLPSEEAARLRALLLSTRPAEYDPSGLQRVGRAIAHAKLKADVNKKVSKESE